MSNPGDRCAREGCRWPRRHHNKGAVAGNRPLGKYPCNAFVEAPQCCPARSGSGEPTDICARPKCLSPRSYNIHDPDRGGHVFVEDAARLVGLVIHQSDPDAAVGSYHGINSSAAILGTFDNCNDAKIFSLAEGNAIYSKAFAAGRALGRDEGAREERERERLSRTCVWDPYTTERGNVLCKTCRWLRDRGPFVHVDKGTPDADAIARRGKEGA